MEKRNISFICESCGAAMPTVSNVVVLRHDGTPLKMAVCSKCFGKVLQALQSKIGG